MKSILLLMLMLLDYHVLPVEAAISTSKNGIIVPGESVGDVKLGSEFSTFEANFPRHAEADEDTANGGCSERIYHWVDVDRDATGVYAYLREGKIYQLSVHTPRFSLANGIKVESSEEQVEKSYPRGRGYVLLHSGSAAVGGQDLTYWVDKRAGVAIELYWNQERKQRLVNGIDIFAGGTDYRPEGCTLPPQEWQASGPGMTSKR